MGHNAMRVRKLSNTNTGVWGSQTLMQTLMQKANCAGCNLQLAVVGIGSAAPLWLTVTKSNRKLPTSMLLQQTQTNRMQGIHMNCERHQGVLQRVWCVSVVLVVVLVRMNLAAAQDAPSCESCSNLDHSWALHQSHCSSS